MGVWYEWFGPGHHTSGCKRDMWDVNDGVDWYKMKKCFELSVFLGMEI
jgi:hypothetical protein